MILYILTLYRPVTIFDLQILRFHKLLSTSIFVCMHVCKLRAKIATVTIMSHSVLLFISLFFSLYIITLTCHPHFLTRLSLEKHAKINDSEMIGKISPQNPTVNYFFHKIRHFRYLTS